MQRGGLRRISITWCSSLAPCFDLDSSSQTVNLLDVDSERALNVANQLTVWNGNFYQGAPSAHVFTAWGPPSHWPWLPTFQTTWAKVCLLFPASTSGLLCAHSGGTRISECRLVLGNTLLLLGNSGWSELQGCDHRWKIVATTPSNARMPRGPLGLLLG